MSFWANLGENAAIGLVKGTIGAGFSALDRYQNYIYGEKAADAADARQRAQWEDMYSWSAQMRDLKNAGLNPSLIMGKPSGQGGATAPQGSGAMGVTSGYAPVDPMTSAQLELLKSQANVNNAEANNLNKDSQNKVQLLENLKQQLKTEQQQTLLTKAEAELMQFKSDLQAINFNNDVALSTGNTELLAKTLLELDNQIEISNLNIDFTQATFDAKCAQVYADLGLTNAQTKVTKAQYGLTVQQTQLCIQHCLESQWKTWAMEKQENRADAQFKLNRQELKEQVNQWLRENKISVTAIKAQTLTSLVNSAASLFRFSFNTNSTTSTATGTFTNYNHNFGHGGGDN